MNTNNQNLTFGIGANLHGLREDLKGAKKEFKHFLGGVKGSFQKINLGGALTGALGGMGLTKIWGQVGETSDQFNRLRIATKTSSSGFGDLKKQALGLNTSLGLNSVSEANQRLQVASRLTKAHGAELSLLTLTAGRLGQAYSDIDENTALKAQAGFMRGFGASAKDSADSFAYLASLGGDLRGEMGDSILEYSTQFKESGFQLKEMVGVLEVASKGGWSVDKVADAFKEGRLKMLGGDQPTMAALDALGLKDLGGQIKKGQVTAAEAMKQVYGKLKDQNKNEQLRLGKEIFGAPFEDAGVGVMMQALGGLGKDPKIKGAAEKLGKELSQSFGYKWKQMTSKLGGVMTRTFDNLGPTLLPIVGLLTTGAEKLSAFVDQYPNLSKLLVLGVTGTGALAFAVGTLAFSFGLLKFATSGILGPFKMLIGLFGWWVIPLAAITWGLMKLEEQTGWVSGAFSALGTGIVDILGPAFGELKSLGTEAWGALVEILGLFGVSLGEGMGLSKTFKNIFVWVGKAVGFVIDMMFIQPIRTFFDLLISVKDAFGSMNRLFNDFNLDNLKTAFWDLARVVGNVFLTVISAIPGGSLLKGPLTKILGKLGKSGKGLTKEMPVFTEAVAPGLLKQGLTHVGAYGKTQAGKLVGLTKTGLGKIPGAKKAADTAKGFTRGAKDVGGAMGELGPLGTVGAYGFSAMMESTTLETRPERGGAAGLIGPIQPGNQGNTIQVGTVISHSRDVGSDLERLADR